MTSSGSGDPSLANSQVTSAPVASVPFSTSGKLEGLPLKQGDHLFQGTAAGETLGSFSGACRGCQVNFHTWGSVSKCRNGNTLFCTSSNRYSVIRKSVEFSSNCCGHHTNGTSPGPAKLPQSDASKLGAMQLLPQPQVHTPEPPRDPTALATPSLEEVDAISLAVAAAGTVAPAKEAIPATSPTDSKAEVVSVATSLDQHTPATLPSASMASQPAEVTRVLPASCSPSASIQAPATGTSAFTVNVSPPSVFAPPPATCSSGSAFSQPATEALVTPSMPPIFGQLSAVPPSPFNQPPATPPPSTSTITTQAATPGFSISAFGGATTSTGFAQPAFGQAPTFGQPASTSSGFTFNQAAFGAAPAFGQMASSTTPASSSGSVFGAPSSTSTTSSFTFGQPAATAGTSLFGQSSTLALGQSSIFRQGASILGGAVAAATPTSLAGFSFCQASAFGSSSPGPMFRQATNTSGNLFGQQTSSGGGLFGSGSSGRSFFSGLEGKPSHEAADKNPFSATGGGFGSSATRSCSRLTRSLRSV
ncbi:Hypothetical predicted protein [Podarcis lilfordi]|uniref:Uncharacterized protein n=1 Tax=Podarcis lilfordi TaxID=74358 RepID=A0AA35PSW3_9SAUR|nr:Hypothetical predicted protein [Podarcis lilfordi]